MNVQHGYLYVRPEHVVRIEAFGDVPQVQTTLEQIGDGVWFAVKLIFGLAFLALIGVGLYLNPAIFLAAAAPSFVISLVAGLAALRR